MSEMPERTFPGRGKRDKTWGMYGVLSPLQSRVPDPGRERAQETEEERKGNQDPWDEPVYHHAILVLTERWKIWQN